MKERAPDEGEEPPFRVTIGSDAANAAEPSPQLLMTLKPKVL